MVSGSSKARVFACLYKRAEDEKGHREGEKEKEAKSKRDSHSCRQKIKREGKEGEVGGQGMCKMGAKKGMRE